MLSHFRVLALAAALVLLPQAALAAPVLDGAAMGWPWALPFLGILLSIATGPLLLPNIWHRHYGKIAFGWPASPTAMGSHSVSSPIRSTRFR